MYYKEKCFPRLFEHLWVIPCTYVLFKAYLKFHLRQVLKNKPILHCENTYKTRCLARLLDWAILDFINII